MKVRILSAHDVRIALPMTKAIETMRLAFGQLSAGEASVPLRSRLETEDGVILFMPAYLRQSLDLGIKIVSVFGDNPKRGLPMVSATVLVLDPETGLPRAFMDGGSLTAIRTGAGGGLAAELLARQDASVVALFGAGVQARAQLQGVLAVRPIQKVNLISRTRASAESMAKEISTWPYNLTVNLVETPVEAIQDADIVITATTSSTPLFNGNDLKNGAHVTGVGSYTAEMQEVDENTIRRARVVVDSREACLVEAGDIIIPKATIDAEIGEIINHKKKGRLFDEEITFFKSVGTAVQDAAAASAVLAEAERKGLGTTFELI